MDTIFINKKDDLLYLPSFGIYPSRVNLYSELKHHFAKIFFSIFLKSGIEFFLFAGSSIGLLRNNKNVPWVDDYDIVVFESFKNKLINEIFPILKEYNFKIVEKKKNKVAGYKIFSNYTKIMEYESFFQCDIFLSKEVSKKGEKYIKNVGKWGLYHRRNVPMNYVRPAKFHKFEDMTLPFFNNPQKDVELEYGDIYNTCVINIRHKPSVFILDDWQTTYNKFNSYKKKSKKNTMELINSKNNKYFNRLVLTSNNKINSIDILHQISSLNIAEILIENTNSLLFLSDIKYYYPNIKIITNNRELFLNNKCMADYFDEILFDINLNDFKYNYKLPKIINQLSNVETKTLLTNSKFANFKFNFEKRKPNLIKNKSLNKKIVNIKGNNVFDLFIKPNNNPPNDTKISTPTAPNLFKPNLSVNKGELNILKPKSIIDKTPKNKKKKEEKKIEPKTKIIKSSITLLKEPKKEQSEQIGKLYNNTVLHEYIKNNLIDDDIVDKKENIKENIKIIKKIKK